MSVCDYPHRRLVDAGFYCYSTSRSVHCYRLVGRLLVSFHLEKQFGGNYCKVVAVVTVFHAPVSRSRLLDISLLIREYLGGFDEIKFYREKIRISRGVAFGRSSAGVFDSFFSDVMSFVRRQDEFLRALKLIVV